MGDLVKLYDENGERVGTYCVETGRAQIGCNFFVVERATPSDKLLCQHCGYSIVYKNDDDVFTWDYCPYCGARVIKEY